MNRSCFLILLCVLFLPMHARAQCTNPPAEMGLLIMNKDHKVMQYCNGDHWIGLWGGGSVQRVSGEVVAFDLAACPDGWSEYIPARGRFIRGIDNGAGNDPDGTRAAGNTQSDEIKSHSHYINSFDVNNPGAAFITNDNSGDRIASTDNAAPGLGILKNDLYVTTNSGGAETRPKNVALLYCRKN